MVVMEVDGGGWRWMEVDGRRYMEIFCTAGVAK
jgi:hypothetical protein